jgi:hypothetical protein
LAIDPVFWVGGFFANFSSNLEHGAGANRLISGYISMLKNDNQDGALEKTDTTAVNTAADDQSITTTGEGTTGTDDGDGSGDGKGDDDWKARALKAEAILKRNKDKPATAPAKDDSEPKDKDAEPQLPADADESAPVTKRDLHKINERKAIRTATTVSDDDKPEDRAIKQEIHDHWDEIKRFYTGRSGKNDPADIVDDILDAHAAWRRRNANKSDGGKAAVATLTRDAGARGSSPSATDVRKAPPRQKEGLANWY